MASHGQEGRTPIPHSWNTLYNRNAPTELAVQHHGDRSCKLVACLLTHRSRRPELGELHQGRLLPVRTCLLRRACSTYHWLRMVLLWQDVAFSYMPDAVRSASAALEAEVSC